MKAVKKIILLDVHAILHRAYHALPGFVSSKGDVYPCGYLPALAGNIRQKPFKMIWEKSKVFNDLRDPDMLKGKCGNCEYRTVCGGCRARAYAATGDYLDEEPYCTYVPVKAVNLMNPSNKE